MGNVIGFVPVPPDKPLSEFIDEIILRDTEYRNEKIEEIEDVIRQFREEGQPVNFAYAGLLNHLNSATPDSIITQKELVHLCASALWYIIEEKGLNYNSGTEDDGA